MHIETLRRSGLEDLQPGEDVNYTITGADYQIESYLRHQASTFVRRFDANTYLYLSRTLTYFDLAREHGSAAKFFADWPDNDFVGLLELMKARAARCAGETAMRFFRTMGKPSFITTRDVVAALIEAGVVAQPPKSKKDLAAVQAAFNGWSRAAGLGLTELSRVLALSAGPIYDPSQTWRQRGGD